MMLLLIKLFETLYFFKKLLTSRKKSRKLSSTINKANAMRKTSNLMCPLKRASIGERKQGNTEMKNHF